MKLTEFGKEMRKLRLDNNELLKDMATRLGVTPAFLSSIESGRKAVPKDCVRRVAMEYGLSNAAASLLQRLADATKTSFEIKLGANTSPRQREAAAVLARRFPTLGDAEIDRLMTMFNRRKD